MVVYNEVENTTSDKSGEDVTDEIEVDSSEVKIYSIEELVPSSSPITIPYLEIYRTNELEFVPYLSPYNVGITSSDSSESESSEDTSENTDESSNDENSENNDESSTNN